MLLLFFARHSLPHNATGYQVSPARSDRLVSPLLCCCSSTTADASVSRYRKRMTADATTGKVVKHVSMMICDQARGTGHRADQEKRAKQRICECIAERYG